MVLLPLCCFFKTVWTNECGFLDRMRRFCSLNPGSFLIHHAIRQYPQANGLPGFEVDNPTAVVKTDGIFEEIIAWVKKKVEALVAAKSIEVIPIDPHMHGREPSNQRVVPKQDQMSCLRMAANLRQGSDLATRGCATGDQHNDSQHSGSACFYGRHDGIILGVVVRFQVLSRRRFRPWRYMGILIAWHHSI